MGIYRSRFEARVAADLKSRKIKFEYEPDKVPYILAHTYTPDLKLPNGIYIELKGRFTSKDRSKMLAVKKQKPDLDIRLVFMNPNVTLSKASTTTYGEWATKHGFIWTHTTVPSEWAKEKPKKGNNAGNAQ